MLVVSEGETTEICADIVNASNPDCPVQFQTTIAIITEANNTDPDSASMSSYASPISLLSALQDHLLTTSHYQELSTLHPVWTGCVWI